MLTTLTGTNHFLLRKELQRRMAEFAKNYGDMGLEKIDGEEADYQRMVEAMQNLPFLASKKLVVLRNPSANKQFVEQFEGLIETIPESNDVILFETKLDKRTGYAKHLKKSSEYVELSDLGERELPAWLVAQAAERGGSLKLGDASYLINRVGANQQLLSGELDKLLSYQPEITRETIDLLTEQAPQSTIFQLLDAAFSGETKRALNLYEDQRKQRIEPQAIIPMLAWQLWVVSIVKTAGKKSIEEIAAESKLNPFVVRKSSSMASKLTLTRLRELVDGLQELDVKLKSSNLDADEALKLYLLSLAS